LPGCVTMQKRLVALGPQQLAMPEGVLRGHTFHYSSCATTQPFYLRTTRPDTAQTPHAGEALYQVGPLQASYFHAWFASSPAATVALFKKPQP
jgi:cobyrinic acid a,c-diamide synthase